MAGQLRRRQSAAEAPEQGRLLSRGSSFTYQDVLEQLIVYTRSGTAAQSDSFGFSLTDGLHTQAGRLEFSVELPRTQPPTVAVSRDLQLPAGTGTGGRVALLGAAVAWPGCLRLTLKLIVGWLSLVQALQLGSRLST